MGAGGEGDRAQAREDVPRPGPTRRRPQLSGTQGTRSEGAGSVLLLSSGTVSF